MPNPDSLDLQSTFSIPHELLIHRSAKFRELLSQDPSIHLPETSPSTLAKFYIWTSTPRPHIDGTSHLDFPQNIDLGIFAHAYALPALTNHTNDALRSNLGDGTWKLNADVVDKVYSATHESSQLRELIRAALGSLPSEEVLGQEEWKEVMLRNSALTWDYLQVSGREWDVEQFKCGGGTCMWHDHGEGQQSRIHVDFCPFRERECFPDELEMVNGIQEPLEVKEEAALTPLVMDQSEKPIEPEVVAAHVKELLADDSNRSDIGGDSTVTVKTSETHHKVGNGIMWTDGVADGVHEPEQNGHNDVSTENLTKETPAVLSTNGLETMIVPPNKHSYSYSHSHSHESTLDPTDPIVDEVNTSLTWDMMASKSTSPRTTKTAPVANGRGSREQDSVQPGDSDKAVLTNGHGHGHGNVHAPSTSTSLITSTGGGLTAAPPVTPIAPSASTSASASLSQSQSSAHALNGENPVSAGTSAAEDFNRATTTNGAVVTADLARTLSEETREQSAENVKVEEVVAKGTQLKEKEKEKEGTTKGKGKKKGKKGSTVVVG